VINVTVCCAFWAAVLPSGAIRLLGIYPHLWQRIRLYWHHPSSRCAHTFLIINSPYVIGLINQFNCGSIAINPINHVVLHTLGQKNEHRCEKSDHFPRETIKVFHIFFYVSDPQGDHSSWPCLRHLRTGCPIRRSSCSSCKTSMLPCPIGKNFRIFSGRFTLWLWLT